MNTQNQEKDLVYIDDYNILGSNFYWFKYEAKGLSKEDILSAGLTDERVKVHRDLIEPLFNIQQGVGERGYTIYIKEGYRAKSLYEIIYKRRVEKFGTEETDKILNMEDMPHANGMSVDVALWDPQENKEVYMRKAEDGADALFVDFYKTKEDILSRQYQELQEWFIRVMQNTGFRLGKKREYFHFDYRPNDPRNYP